MEILRDERITETNVYGLFAGLPERTKDNLPRWKAPVENSAQEQLAIIPPAADDDDRVVAAFTGWDTVGAPYLLDIDSIA